VAHGLNPSYSRGRDRENHSLKPAWANSAQDPIMKKKITKIGLVEWLKVKTLHSNPSITHTHKKLVKNTVKIIVTNKKIFLQMENFLQNLKSSQVNIIFVDNINSPNLLNN
jgi:hypothetical protein